ncbi:MAG: outer membrane beta-barrel protein, partial [Stellaceae bacterium]
MKTRYLLGAGAALALALSSAGANAQFAWMGGPYPVLFYVGPEGGWTSLANQKDTVATPTFQVNHGAPVGNLFNLSSRYDSGYNVGGRLGIQWGPWRLEEEYSYRHNSLSSLGGFFGPNTNTAFTGSRITNSLMTNVIYDFTLGWPVTPHIGVGVGAVENRDSATLNTLNTGPNPILFTSPNFAGSFTVPPNSQIGGTFLKSSNAWTFGYQAIVGVRYDINPLLAFDVDYRYLATTDPTITNKGVFPLPPFGFPGTRYTTGYT